MPDRITQDRSRTHLVLAAALAGIAGCEVPARAPDLAGIVHGPGGTALGSAFVTARSVEDPFAISTLTDSEGRFRIGTPPGEYEITAHRPGYAPATVAVRSPAGSGDGSIEIGLRPASASRRDVPSSAYLSLLPDGEQKRRFVLDCTGCHVFDATIALADGSPRTAEGWREAIDRMLGFAGPASSFPVISGRDPAGMAEFLARHIATDPGERLPLDVTWPPEALGEAYTVTEYDLPEPGDLPHDLQVDGEGRIVITGMFTHRMYRLHPESARFETVPIPVENANPRAIEIDERGDWWVLLGAPMKVARYRPDADEWEVHDIGMYPHSIGVDGRGHVWFNGHFTRDPELVGRMDPGSGAIEHHRVPTHPAAGLGAGPIPYELRVGPDGRIWGSELAGNRVFGLDPASGAFELTEMAAPHSGPRRLDVAPDGTVWIPQYAANRLARLEPASGRLAEFALPIADAGPYIARTDPERGRVWIGTGSADALLSFDPAAERFTVYPLPTRGTLVRHLSIDSRSGAVWAAYGAAPGIPAKVARLQPGTGG